MIILSTNGTVSTGYPNAQKKKKKKKIIFTSHHTHKLHNLKWIIFLNIKDKVIKFLEEYIKENLCDLHFLRQKHSL